MSQFKPVGDEQTPIASCATIEQHASDETPWRGVHVAAMVGLIALAAASSFYQLGGGAVLTEHECLVAQTAREMAQRDSYFLPYYGDVVRLRKTPLAYWSVLVTQAVSGRLDTFSARLPSALTGVALTLVVVALGSSLYGRRGGLIAGFVFATSAAYFKFTHDATVDLQLTLYCAICYWCFWRGLHAATRSAQRVWYWGFYVSLGVAMLAKAPLPAATVVLPLFLYLLVSRQLRQIPRMCLITGTLIFAVVFLPWVVYIVSHVPNATDRWISEYADRYIGTLSTRKQGWYYYLPFVFAFVLPWSLFVPEAIAGVAVERYRTIRQKLLYPFVWFVVSLVFVSSAGFKRAHYLLPALPGLCLLLVPVLERVFFGRHERNRRRENSFTAVVIGVLLVGLIGAWLWIRSDGASYHAYLDAYVVVALIIAAGLGLTAISFMLAKRPLSFAALCLTSVITAACIWSAVGVQDGVPAEEIRFAGLVRDVVPAGADVRWLRRQDGRVLFYGDLVIPRFIEPMDLLQRLKSERRKLKQVREMVGQMLDERLRDQAPVWIVMRQDDLVELQSMLHTPAVVVASGVLSERDMVIVTNTQVSAPTTTQQSATSMSRGDALGHHTGQIDKSRAGREIMSDE